MKKIVFSATLCMLSACALAKIPAPELSDEAKAKAAEAAAKTAWSGKMDAYQLCKAQDRVAAHAAKTAKAKGKDVKAAKETPACADPGPFAYAPAGAASAPAGKTAAKVAPGPAAAAKKS